VCVCVCGKMYGERIELKTAFQFEAFAETFAYSGCVRG
jgi:hypothetical protein